MEFSLTHIVKQDRRKFFMDVINSFRSYIDLAFRLHNIFEVTFFAWGFPESIKFSGTSQNALPFLVNENAFSESYV